VSEAKRLEDLYELEGDREINAVGHPGVHIRLRVRESHRNGPKYAARSCRPTCVVEALTNTSGCRSDDKGRASGFCTLGGIRGLPGTGPYRIHPHPLSPWAPRTDSPQIPCLARGSGCPSERGTKTSFHEVVGNTEPPPHNLPHCEIRVTSYNSSIVIALKKLASKSERIEKNLHTSLTPYVRRY
jgi:hypothetical protein